MHLMLCPWICSETESYETAVAAKDPQLFAYSTALTTLVTKGSWSSYFNKIKIPPFNSA